MLRELLVENAEETNLRFLLVPNNQFGYQEPDANSEIKTFVVETEHIVLGDVVTLLAKSELGAVKTEGSASYDVDLAATCVVQVPEDVCMPQSMECCPKNDEVYGVLEKQLKDNGYTHPFVEWNFEAIVVGFDGMPLQIIRGENFEDDLKVAIQCALNVNAVDYAAAYFTCVEEASLVERPSAESLLISQAEARVVGVSADGATWHIRKKQPSRA